MGSESQGQEKETPGKAFEQNIQGKKNWICDHFIYFIIFCVWVFYLYVDYMLTSKRVSGPLKLELLMVVGPK